MIKFTNQQKDNLLCSVAESSDRFINVDLKNGENKDIVQHLIDLDVLEKIKGRITGFGDKQRIGLTKKGAEMYATGGFREKRKAEVIEKIWKAVEILKP